MSQFSWSVPPENGPGTRGPQSVSVARLQGALSILRTHRSWAWGLVVLAVGAVLMNGITPSGDIVSSETQAPPASAPSPSSPPAPAAPVAVLEERPTYWIGDHELEGAHASLPIGAPVEIWVTWSPPLTKEIQVRKLIDDAYVAALLPPSTPDGFLEIGLALRHKDVQRMIYGERFGQLTVVEKKA